MAEPSSPDLNRALTPREAFDQLYSFFLQSPIPAVFTRLSDWRIVDINERAAQLIGNTREDLIGKTSEDLGVWTSEEQLDTMTRQLHGQSSHSSLEINIRVRSGDVRILLVSSVQVLYRDEPHLISFCLDITDRKRAEEKVRDLALRLTRAEEEERRRIAHVLHDDLQQVLYGVQLRLTAIKQSGRDPDAANLSECLTWIGDAIDITRRLTSDLNPPVLAHDNLTEALFWLVLRLKERYDLDIELQAEEPVVIPDPNFRVLLYQVTRELLFNVVKHADTRHANLEVVRRHNQLTIRVKDKGRGFDPEQMAESSLTGLGLFASQERLNLVGGKMEIKSVPGKGTCIAVQVSLPFSTNDPTWTNASMR